MSSGSPKPEWDTPPHGDFASYVERLTAPRPVKPAAVPGRGAPGAPDASSAPGQVLAPDFAQWLSPWMGALRGARAVLLLLAGLHGAALFFLGWGSLAGVVAMGMLWWGMGWLLDVAPRLLPSPGTVVRGSTDSLQARQRPAGPLRTQYRKKEK